MSSLRKHGSRKNGMDFRLRGNDSSHMNFFKQLRKLNLTEAEKQQSLDFLLSRIETVRNYYNNRHNKQKVTLLPLLLNHKYMLAGLLIAAILAMGGGTAAAAENTVPGDLLYPIKTRVNEEVRAALSVTPEAKISWEARRAERRLEEVEKLSEKNKLTTATSQMLADKFKEFAERADDRLAKLKDKGKLTDEQAEKLRENFEVAIKAHEEVLSRLEEREQARGQLKEVLQSLREQASSTIKARLEHEWELLNGNVSTALKTVADNRKNAAQNKTTEVEKFIANNAEKVSAENKLEAEKKLAEAKKIVAEGDIAYSESKYGEAIIKYSEAHRKAQEAQMYMTTRFRLERRLNFATSTSELFASGTLQFNNEKRQEVWDTKENFRNVEEKLREEVRQAKEKVKEFRKETNEKIRDIIKNKQAAPAVTGT